VICSRCIILIMNVWRGKKGELVRDIFILSDYLYLHKHGVSEMQIKEWIVHADVYMAASQKPLS